MTFEEAVKVSEVLNTFESFLCPGAILDKYDKYPNSTIYGYWDRSLFAFPWKQQFFPIEDVDIQQELLKRKDWRPRTPDGE